MRRSEDTEPGMRVIAVINVDGLIAQSLNGLVVDAKGSVQVGEVQAHPAEAKEALAATLDIMADASIEINPNDPNPIMDELINDQDLLPLRQRTFGDQVERIRANPQVLTSRK